VRALYGNEVSYEDRSYRTIVNGKLVDGVADHVIVRGGQQIAVEAKYVEDWNKSLRNPDGSSGGYPWSVRAQQEMVNQASKYSSFFDGGVIYHTNSSELATHYTNLFEKLGVQNFRFVITPANRK
jgi:filamentous hemagglutinin